MLKLPIYMDNNATTPLDPRVLEAMMPYLTTEFGNAASRSHAFGWKAEEAVQKAGEQIARLIGGDRVGDGFSSGGPESGELAPTGGAPRSRRSGNPLVPTPAPAPAGLEALMQ